MTIHGTSSHPESRHLLDATTVAHADTATCTLDGCPVTVTRCTWSDLWPWACDHCGPLEQPDITNSGPARPYVIAHPVAVQAPTPRPPRTALALDLDRESFRDADLHDVVVALVEPTRHRQPYTVRDNHGTWITRRWETTHPSLLEQLGSAVAQSAAAEEGPRAGFASKPAARLDAIDGLDRITRETEAWLRRLGLPVPYRPGPHGTSDLELVTGIRRVAANATAGKDRDALMRDVRSWWILARIVTGWDSPAWKPQVACPLCSVVGGLRIRLDVQVAVCLECRGEWDSQTIGLLADHVRAEKETEEPTEGEVPESA